MPPAPEKPIPARPFQPPRPRSESPTPRDEALVAAAQKGDRAALSALLSRHQDRIFAVCLRMVGGQEAARDLAQDAMVRLMEGLAGFDGRASFTTWMTRVTMNVCLSHMRRQKLRRHASLDAPAGGASGSASRNNSHSGPEDRGSGWMTMEHTGEPGVVEGVQAREELQRLKRALAELDDEQRAILILRDASDLDYSQIADVLGVAVGTVKSRLFRARAALREAMER